MEKKEKVAIIRCKSYNQKEVDKAVSDIFDLLNFKIKDKIKVLIKPNILAPHNPKKGITTHPSIIEAVCKILKKSKATIYIGESSFFDTERAFKESEIAKIAEKYGKKINFESERLIEINDKNAKILKKFHIPKIIKEVDLVINIGKLKTHTLTKLSLCVKNIFGCIPGGFKQKCHKLAPSEKLMSELLVDIYQNIKPELNIIDGVIGMEGNGPSTGSLKNTGLIFGSRNAPSLDYVISDIVGFNPKEVYTTKICIKRKLLSPKRIEIVGDKTKRINYKKPINYTKIGFIVFIYNKILEEEEICTSEKKCIRCGLCKQKCPVKAIELKPFPKVNKKKCIRCFCCMEACPKHAVYLKEKIIIRLLKRWSNLIKN